MPPKRGKSKGRTRESSSTADIIDGKFVDVKAKTLFWEFMEKDKPMIMERGLRPPEHDTEDSMSHNIEKRGWIKLTDSQDPAVISVVREFYANGRLMRNGDEVFVRGKMVSFSPETINQFFEVATVENSEYQLFLEKSGEYDVILQEMCIPGTKWISKKDDEDVAVYFPENTLNIYAKGWNKFICASIMPTKHEHHIQTNRAGLLYAICKGWSIDIGKVIRDALIRSLEGKTTGGHTHPCLITNLCRLAGVQMHETEPKKPCRPFITKHSLERFFAWPGGTHVVSGMGFELINENVAPPRRPLPRIRRSGNEHRGVSGEHFKVLEERQRINEENQDRQPSQLYRQEMGSSSTPHPKQATPCIQEMYRMTVENGRNIAALQSTVDRQGNLINQVLHRLTDEQQRGIMRGRYEREFHAYLASRAQAGSSTTSSFPEYPEYLIRPYNPPPSPLDNEEDEEE